MRDGKHNKFTKESIDKALEYLNGHISQGALLYSILDEAKREAINEQYILPHIIELINEGLEQYVTSFYAGDQRVSFNITGYETIREILLEDQK